MDTSANTTYKSDTDSGGIQASTVTPSLLPPREIAVTRTAVQPAEVDQHFEARWEDPDDLMDKPCLTLTHHLMRSSQPLRSAR